MSEEQTTPKAEEQPPCVEELKVQGKDLQKAIDDIVREGTVRRVVVTRNDRMLLNIPLAVGVAGGAVLAFYMPFITAIAAGAALLGGCMVRIERDEPPAVS
ncbi:MAG: DUF4342 domain-containing protein [Anaerolineae bacterium]|nr:DUF4342 domain-containing protein [Anaerolineae bacterium]